MKKVIIFLFAVLLTLPAMSQGQKNQPKPVTTEGLFTVTKTGPEWTFEIPKEYLGRKFLATVRYTATPGGTQTYGGELSNEQMVYWEEAPDDRLLLRAEPLTSVASEYDAVSKAVKVSHENPIIGTFKIESRDNGKLKVKVTYFFSEDNTALGISSRVRRKLGLGGMLPAHSYIDDIKTFPMNTEVRLIRTYTAHQENYYSAQATGRMTLGLNISFVLLPEKPMIPRIFDPRVGYFIEGFYHFSDYQQKVDYKRYITRWRLEPKDSADMEKMKRGELVEPKKPIVFYIDPATPKRWRKYLIQGVNDWQKAFEKAGFKKAIYAEEWPDSNKTMSMEDARYSVIRYLASDIPNAYGPHVHDPRSGEILESHICWYHNVMKLVHDWYLVQAATLDEAARHPSFDEDLMGQLIRFVSSHEVGHTLGLRHNFGSSSTVPIDSLRNKAWVEKHGHTPSIMDYARFNFVAQPEDSISRAGIFPRIGDYDEWAIQWGYTPMFNAYDDESDRYELQKLMNTKDLSSKSRLWFGDGETRRHDPRCLTEDLGDDVVKMVTYGLKNLKRIIPQLQEWSYEGNDIHSENLRNTHYAVCDQFYRYLGHLTSNIGGYYDDYKTVDQEGDIYRNAPEAHTLRVLNYIEQIAFHEPIWLIDAPYIKRLFIDPSEVTARVGRTTISRLLSRTEMLNGDFTVTEYLPELSRRLFREIKTAASVNNYRRELQSTFISTLTESLSKTTKADSRAAILFTLRQLQKQLKMAKGANITTQAHYESLADQIDRALVIK